MALSVDQAQAQLDSWLAASTAVATNQSYSITVEGNTRLLTRANAADILKMVTYWQGQVATLTRRAAGRGRVRYFAN